MASSWCATCTAQRPTKVYMLDPRIYCSDGAFHCEPCWRKHGGFRPERKEHVRLPATVCADCGEEKSPLHMEDQYNAKSDLQFRCESCWEKKSGGVPDKSAQYPVDTAVTNLKDIAFDGKPLRHLRVTDLAFPDKGDLGDYGAKLRAVLERGGAHVEDGVDGTVRHGSPQLVVWGSPHPHAHTNIEPAKDLSGSTNGEFKINAFDHLRSLYPEAAIVMPVPQYYQLEAPDGARILPLKKRKVHGVTYVPLASTNWLCTRLCRPDQVMAVASKDCCAPEDTELDLATLVRRYMAAEKQVLFLGEYVCTLSFVSAMVDSAEHRP